MRITHVETTPITIPPADPAFVWRSGLLGSPRGGQGALLRVITDEGIEGHAISVRPGTDTALRHFVDTVLRAELVGGDPLAREHWWHRLWEIDRTEELPNYLLSLTDVALWDIAGKQAQLPAWQLMGGARKELPAYASTSTFSSIEEYLDVADQCLELGYTAIKLHAWGDARRDAQLSRRLREHVGPDVPLMFDGSAGFDLPDAVYLGRALAELDYLWYEEPMLEFSVTAYKWLAEKVDVPLLVAETSDGAHMNTADFIASGAASMVRIGTELRGGFTGALRIAHLADAFRLRAEVHGPTLTSRHLCMAVSNTSYYESLVTSNPVTREDCVDANGMIQAPSGVGVGLPTGIDYPLEVAR